MPWIKIRDTFHIDPKIIPLSQVMGWSDYHTKGFLIHFWDWALKHCDNGDISSYKPSVIGRCFGLDEDESQKLIEAMAEIGWLDKEPYLRIHNWWNYQKEYLKMKHWKNDGWRDTQKAYETGEKPPPIEPKDFTKIPQRAKDLAALLLKLIKENNPNCIATERQINPWANSFRLLNEKDGQPYDLIEKVIICCQNDEFWKNNILSGVKLRGQWNRLTLLLQGGKHGNRQSGKPGKYI